MKHVVRPNSSQIKISIVAYMHAIDDPLCINSTPLGSSVVKSIVKSLKLYSSTDPSNLLMVTARRNCTQKAILCSPTFH